MRQTEREGILAGWTAQGAVLPSVTASSPSEYGGEDEIRRRGGKGSWSSESLSGDAEPAKDEDEAIDTTSSSVETIMSASVISINRRSKDST
jgi:hypothetical protein